MKTDIVDKGGGIMLPQDPDSMGSALVSLLEDQNRLTQLGNSCRKLAEEDFDFGICAPVPVSLFPFHANIVFFFRNFTSL